MDLRVLLREVVKPAAYSADTKRLIHHAPQTGRATSPEQMRLHRKEDHT